MYPDEASIGVRAGGTALPAAAGAAVADGIKAPEHGILENAWWTCRARLQNAGYPRFSLSNPP